MAYYKIIDDAVVMNDASFTGSTGSTGSTKTSKNDIPLD